MEGANGAEALGRETIIWRLLVHQTTWQGPGADLESRFRVI